MASDTAKVEYEKNADGKLCSEWDKRFSRCVDARQEFERQWYLNFAFYYGRQWVGWLGTPGIGKYTLQDYPVRNPQEVRVVANKVQPAIRNELTKLTKEEIQYYVVPSTSENEDIAAARAAQAISDQTLEVGGFNKARREATFWTLMCGTGLINTFPTGQISQEMGKSIPDKIITKNTPTFNLYVPNLQLTDIEDQPYLFHSYMADPKALYDTYGVETQPEALPPTVDFRRRLLQMMGVKNDEGSNGVLVKELYIKSGSEFPNGAFIVIAGKRLVYISEKLDEVSVPVPDLMINGSPVEQKQWVRPKNLSDEEVNFHKKAGNTLGYKTAEYPFKHGQYPFAKIDHIPSGRFYGLSVVEGMIPLQKEYNRARSQIRMGANRTASPQWTYQEGSVPNIKKLSNKPGEVIPYRVGFTPPAPVKNPDMPSYAIQDQDRILKDIDDFTGQYEVSHGRTPPGVEAASAIAYLQEENDTRLYHTSASIEEAAQKVGYQCLSLIQQLWSADKIIKVTSKNNKDDVEAFKVSDMKNNTDIRVEPGSAAPKSRAARQALIMELMKNGWIAPEDGLKYLQMVETNRLWDDMQIDSRQVQRENMMFKKGGDVIIHSYDNHQLHVMFHQRWMKTQDFEVLPEEIKQKVEVHVQQHKMELIKFDQQQQQQEQGAVEENAGTGREPAVGTNGV